MNKIQMNEIKNCRKNLTGFLHFSEIERLNVLFSDFFNVDKKSFYQICDKAIELYANKHLTNKQISFIFEILKTVNSSFKIESHRIDGGSIFEYCNENGCYLFLKKGTAKEFRLLNHYTDF